MPASRRSVTGSQSHRLIPALLLSLWIGVACGITTIQYRHNSNPLFFVVSFILLASAPLLPGLFARCLRPFMTTGFYSRDRGDTTQIHLSPWANARCRHPRDVALLKKQLNLCIAGALVRGRTVTLRSHLLTRKRTDEIVRYLTTLRVPVICTLRERPTPPAERALLFLIYLLADLRYAQIGRTGMDVTLQPVHPYY